MKRFVFATLCTALLFTTAPFASAQSDQLPRGETKAEATPSEEAPQAETNAAGPETETPDAVEDAPVAPVEQEKVEPESPPQKIITASQAEKFEGLGLFNRSSSQTLGDDFWQGTKRSELAALYKSIPAVSENPGVQKLIRRTLLTQADARNIENDVDIKAGEDLLTLRLEKLLEAGLYADARALFGQLNDDPYDDRLARAGLLAVLFSGEKALACIDANTFAGDFADDSFTHFLIDYCEVSSSEKASETAQARIQNSPYDLLKTLKSSDDTKIAYSPESFSKLSLIEQAVVVGEKRLDLSGLAPRTIEAAPPSHLPFLIDSKLASDDLQFQLMLRAIEWGYQYQKPLENFYMNALPTAGGTPPKVQPGSTIEAIALLYSEAKTAQSNEDAWQAIDAAMKATKDFGPAAMVPFTDAIGDIQPPEGLSPAKLVHIFEIFLLSGDPIPANWAQYQMDANQIKSEPKLALQKMLVAYFLSPTQQHKQTKAEQIYSTINIKNDKDLFFLDNLIENVDNKALSIHNPSTIYEKEYNLTFKHDYVMPSMRIWNRLLDAGENRNITKTALLSTVMLKDQTAQTLYPGLLRNILSSLENVGLTDISNDLAVYASIRNI